MISDSSTNNNNVWFIKQRIGNACGTIGLLHSLLNVPDSVFKECVVNENNNNHDNSSTTTKVIMVI